MIFWVTLLALRVHLRIDSTHRKWLVASLIILGVSAIIYAIYAASSPVGPSGGSATGLAFGVVGSAFMIFAGLLAGRKKWRCGDWAARKPGCVAISGLEPSVCP